MRTADPRNIRKDFLHGLDDVGDVLSNLTPVWRNKSKNLLVELSFLGAATLLEGFLGDLFVAYINKKPGRFASKLTGTMSVSTEDVYAARAKAFAVVDIRSHLTLEKVRSILDPSKYNVTFADTADLKAKAGRWLEQPYRSHFLTLSQGQYALIEATKAIRNYLAHRSTSSLLSMQEALTGPDLPPGFRRGPNLVLSVGKFLHSRPMPHQPRRIDFYVAELRLIATALYPD